MPRYSPRTGMLQEYQVGPFSNEHIYVQWGGTLAGEEEWSCSVRMLNEVGHSPDEDISILAEVAAALTAFHARPATKISPNAVLTYVKANLINVDGTYQKNTTNEFVTAATPGGGSGTGFVPNQVACVVSLTTGVTRGPAHRGRFYLPCPLATVAADGRISVGDATGIKGSAETLLSALNAATPGTNVVVMSRKAGAPTFRPVTGIEVGRVLDTQRRRRKSLVENYS